VNWFKNLFNSFLNILGEQLIVEETTYEYTKCRSAHMTLFGGGFFVQPNTIDFDYVFKYSDFSDNTTIYSTMIICLATFLILLLWARWKDTRDILVIYHAFYSLKN
jgi:hypothetical protein